MIAEIEPSTAMLEEASVVAALLQHGTGQLPFVSVGDSGEVELAWVGNGVRVEIEVSGVGTASVFVRRPGLADIERILSLDHLDLRAVVARSGWWETAPTVGAMHDPQDGRG